MSDKRPLDDHLRGMFEDVRLPNDSLQRIQARMRAERGVQAPSLPPLPKGLFPRMVKTTVQIGIGIALGVAASSSRLPWAPTEVPASPPPTTTTLKHSYLAFDLQAQLFVELNRLVKSPANSFPLKTYQQWAAASEPFPFLANPWSFPFGVNYEIPLGGRVIRLDSVGLEGFQFRFARTSKDPAERGRRTAFDHFQLTPMSDLGRSFLAKLNLSPGERGTHRLRAGWTASLSQGVLLLKQAPREVAGFDSSEGGWLRSVDQPNQHNAPSPGLVLRLLAPRARKQDPAARLFGYTRAGAKLFGIQTALGEKLSQPFCDHVRPSREGRAAIQQGKYWGFVGPKGTPITKVHFDEVRDFHEGRAAVRKDAFWGYIDERGRTVIPLELFEAQSFTNGRALVRNTDGYTFLDEGGRKLGHQPIELARPFKGGLAAVRIAGKWTFFDVVGRRVFYPRFDEVRDFHEGVAFARVGPRWHILLENGTGGKFEFPIRGEPLGDFSDGLAPVRLNDRCGFVGYAGEVKIPLQYKGAEEFRDGYGLVHIDGKFHAIDPTGKDLGPLKVKGYRNDGESLWDRALIYPEELAGRPRFSHRLATLAYDREGWARALRAAPVKGGARGLWIHRTGLLVSARGAEKLRVLQPGEVPPPETSGDPSTALWPDPPPTR